MATGPRNHQSVGHHIPTWNEYEQTIKSIYSCVTKNNLNLIIKRHPDTAENDFSPDFYSKLSGVKIFKTGDLLELLNDSYLVISLGVTSSILEAQILEKPVISINVKYDIFGSTKYIPKSCPHIFIDEFENLLSELMNEPDKVSRLIQKGETAINENINNIGESSENLFNTLKRLE